MHRNTPNLNPNIYFEPLVLLGEAQIARFGFLKSSRVFFQPNLPIFRQNGLYQPPEQLLGGGKCRFWNRPFIITPYRHQGFFSSYFVFVRDWVWSDHKKIRKLTYPQGTSARWQFRSAWRCPYGWFSGIHPKGPCLRSSLKATKYFKMHW